MLHDGGQWTLLCQSMLPSLPLGYHKIKQRSSEREKYTAGMGLETLLATGVPPTKPACISKYGGSDFTREDLKSKAPV